MYEIKCDVAVIGAGPAGLAAAVAAKKQGAERVLVVERDRSVGGILQQCIHPGFGLTYFNEELTGPEYAGRFIDEAQACGVEFLCDTMVLEVLAAGTLICSNTKYGVVHLEAGSVVLAMGCRERTRGNLAIPGTRPAGIYTAGAAQRLINRQNKMVGRKIVILGSGDIGMIMARRLTLEGAEVIAVIEIMDYLAGLTRNRVQCLDDFGIPLLLSHTVTDILGKRRVEGVKVAKVDSNRIPLKETETLYPCDTLLLSVGLIPENELSGVAGVAICSITNGPVVNQHMQTSIPTIFACGNVVHVNDLVDNVSKESEIAGRAAALYAMGELPESMGKVECVAGANVRYLCPHEIALTDESEEVALYFRVLQPERNVRISVHAEGRELASRKAIKVNPGEIEQISVKTDDLSDGAKITLEVVKEGGTS